MDDRKLTVCYGRGNYKQAPPQIFYRVSGWNRSDSPQRIKLLWNASRGSLSSQKMEQEQIQKNDAYYNIMNFL